VDGGADDETQPDAEWWPLRWHGVLPNVYAFNVADLGWRLQVGIRIEGRYRIYASGYADEMYWSALPREVTLIDREASDREGMIHGLATLRMTMMEMVRVGRELRDRGKSA
jgi:hypothetical protein